MKNLKKMRLARHLSQQKLADRFGLSQQSIYKYENNLSEPDIQSSEQNILSSDDRHLLYLYHCLSEEEQQHILAILEALAD